MVAPSIFSLLLIILLSPLLFLHSAGECPESFDCGAHNLQIGFPLSNTTFPKCGLYTVNCTGPIPKLNLGAVGLDYRLRNYSSNSLGNSIRVFDSRLNGLISFKSCDVFSFYLNWTLPITPSISFTVSPNLSLYKCTTKDNYFRGYDNYRGCRGYTVYFNYSNRNQVSNHSGLPQNCIFFAMPVVSDIGNRNSSDLLSVLASEFNITFHESKKCLKCRREGGQCARDSPVFKCLKEKKVVAGRSRLILILGTVIPGVVILVLYLVIIILRGGKWIHASSYIPSKKASSDLSSGAGLEGGSAYFGASVFSYAELEEATHDFDPSKELGDGGFGTVYHGKLRDGREVAVKRLYERNYKQVKQFMTEIEILTRLSHPNLVTLHGCTTRQSRELLLVYEYIPNGTVADHLHGDRAKDGPLAWPIRMNIAIETASALAYLHASEIIHRDVKTTNILLDNDFHVKVGDFGLSRLFPTNATHVSTAPQGTPGYVDPEYHRCYQLTDKSDVYSFGVVLIELVSSLPAVDMDRDRDEINLANLAVNRIHNRALNELIDPSLGFQSDPEIERMTTSVAEVAFRCLQLETEMRPTMEEVLEALKEIEGYKDDNNGVLNETVGVLTSTKRLPFSPEGDNVVLLKNNKPPLLPASVTNSWVSGSTTSVSSG